MIELWWEQYPIFISFGGSLLVVLVSHYIAHLFEKIKIRRKLFLVQENFRKSLIDILHNIDDWIPTIRVLSNMIIEEQTPLKTVLPPPTLSVESIYRIGYQNVFEAFENVGSQSIVRVFTAVDQINILQQQVLDDFERFDVAISDLLSNWEVNFNRTLELRDEYLRDHAELSLKKTNPQKDVFFDMYQSIVAKWEKQDPNLTLRSVAVEYYLQPTLELCKNNLHDPRAIEVSKYLTKCFMYYEELHGALKHFSGVFKLAADAMTDYSLELHKFQKG